MKCVTATHGFSSQADSARAAGEPAARQERETVPSGRVHMPEMAVPVDEESHFCCSCHVLPRQFVGTVPKDVAS